MKEKELLRWTVATNEKKLRAWQQYKKMIIPALFGLGSVGILFIFDIVNFENLSFNIRFVIAIIAFALALFLLGYIPGFLPIKWRYIIYNKGISKVGVYKYNAFRAVQQEKIQIAKKNIPSLFSEPGNQWYWPFRIVVSYKTNDNIITLISKGNNKFEIITNNNLEKVKKILDKLIT